MSNRTNISVDSRGRISVQKLGFQPSSTVVAESFPDGSVVIRKASVLTQAELDLLSNPKNIEDLRMAVREAQEDRTEPARRSS
jgi:hypothetical protein